MAGGHVQLLFGQFKFYTKNAPLDGISRESTYRWPAQERIARPVAMQFTGEGEYTITLKGYYYPHETGGRMFALDGLRAIAEEGVPKFLITGTGINLGEWCITSIGDTFTEMLDDSRAKKVEFTVTLKKYFKDGLKK